MVKKSMAITYSGNLINQQDPERFLLSVLMPAQYHQALWALFAFNYEVSKTRDVVTETTIGLIRLQWWREAIGEIYDGKPVREHQVLTDLANAIKQYELPRELFETLIYTYEFDLEGVAPANENGLDLYLDGTEATLSQLAIAIVGGQNNDTLVHAVSRDYGRVRIARTLPNMLSSGHVMISSDVLEAHNLNSKKICDFNCKEQLTDVLKQFLSGVHFKNKPKNKYLKALSIISKIHHKRIVANSHNVFKSEFGRPPRFFALRVWLGSL